MTDMVERVTRAMAVDTFHRSENDPDTLEEYVALVAPTLMPLARAAIGPMMEWQDIETAPKDGTMVLVYVPRRLGALYAGASNPTGSQWWSRNIGDVQPTHWMPLPNPPSPA